MNRNLTGLMLFALIAGIVMLFGCDKPPQNDLPAYFEIIDQKASSFEEVIIANSGEYFLKTGKENLDLNNTVFAGEISPSKGKELLKSAIELSKKGIECNEQMIMKELIVFDKSSTSKKCFDLNDASFDDLMASSKNEALKNPPKVNFFLHLIYNEKSAASDYHVHSNGLVIKTFYTFSNGLGSSQILRLPNEKINELIALSNDEVLMQDSDCTFGNGEYDYAEIQRNFEYNYYINCSTVSAEKKEFFEKAHKILEDDAK